MDSKTADIVEIGQKDLIKILLPLATREMDHANLRAKVMGEFDVTEENANDILELLQAQDYIQGAGISGGYGFHGASPYGYTLSDNGKKLLQRNVL
ncbi:MAG: hypothetical protein KJ955_03915 [Nanoarchaeota archaeon]|nr:hypothetical protein [Nanoarchaeota archaeon]